MKVFAQILALISLFNFSASFAQVAEKVEDRTKRATERRLEREADETVNELGDAIERGIGNIFKKKDKQKEATPEPPPQPKPVEKEPETVQRPEAGNSETKPAQPSKINSGSSLAVYSKFDFIPGEQILFFDNFNDDAIGDFPSLWNTNGGGEVVNIENEEQKYIKLASGAGYTPMYDKPLPENYTLEFDLITTGLDYEGLAGSRFTFSFFSDQVLDRNHAKNGAEFNFSLWKGAKASKLQVQNFGKDVTMKINNSLDFPIHLKLNEKIHFSIMVNKRRLRLYIDESKVLDLPTLLQGEAGRFVHFDLQGINESLGHRAMIGNFKIAETGEDIRSQLMQNGKFSTTGIYFNVNSAEIKPESYGVLKSIANVLAADPTLKVTVVGHTDSDGEEQFNLKLSKQRAESVKKALISEFAISAGQIESDGKGEAEPVAENTSQTGKASNRRVEFIRN